MKLSSESFSDFVDNLNKVRTIFVVLFSDAIDFKHDVLL